VAPGLRVVFCGTAPGAASARAGAYYAGPGNRFWLTLREVSLTPVLLHPAEFARLPEFGIGLTDASMTASPSTGAIGGARTWVLPSTSGAPPAASGTSSPGKSSPGWWAGRADDGGAEIRTRIRGRNARVSTGLADA
jgi:G:T/U-mismatch repair DNA glycosylase